MQGDEEFTSAFPKSVQPGKPKLNYVPTGWVKTSLKHHLEKLIRPIRLADDVTYELVTVKRSRGGVIRRESLPGRLISVKSQFMVATNDFLISKRQIVHGACGVVPSTLEGSIVSNEYDVFRCRPTLDLAFLKYLSHTVYFQQTCFHSSIGVHVEKMIFKTERWLKFPFALPPHVEQVKIAEILSTWDKSIEATERLLENSKKRKKALMQQLLTGKRRLSRFHGEWLEGEIGEVITNKSKKFDPSKSDKTFQCIELEHIESGTGTVSGCISTETSNSIKNQFSQGDVLYGKLRPYLNKYCRAPFDGVCSSEIWVLSPTKSIDRSYLYFLVQSERFGAIANKCSGSKMPRADWNLVSTFPVALPSIDEQRAIAEILEIVEEEIHAYSNKVRLMLDEKKALMQQLLTGKKRIKVEKVA